VERLGAILEGFHPSGELAKCLEIMLVDVQKDVTRSHDNQVKLVRGGKFGEFLNLFGPIEKLPKV